MNVARTRASDAGSRWVVAISWSRWYPQLFLLHPSCASLHPWNGPNAFPQAPVPSSRSPRCWDGVGTGLGTPREHSLGLSAELLAKKRARTAPGWPGMVSFPSSLIQLAFGSGWERGCWSLLERRICSLATGSKAAKPRQGLRRAAPGSQVPIHGRLLPANLSSCAVHSLPKAQSTPCPPLLPSPSPAAPSPALLALGGISCISEDYWVLGFLSCW